MGAASGTGITATLPPSRGSVTPHATQKRYIAGFVVPHVGHLTAVREGTPPGPAASTGSAGSFVLPAGAGATGAGGGPLSGRERDDGRAGGTCGTAGVGGTTGKGGEAAAAGDTAGSATLGMP
jgi:hypothetical protein